MPARGVALALLLLAGCDRIPTQTSEHTDAIDAAARDAAEETARKDADNSTAVELVALRSRIDQLEADDRNNLDEHSRMMNAVVETRNADAQQTERIRNHYNEHLRIYHGVQ